MIWFNGQFTETANASLLSHSLHYGGAVFEGIRFYQKAGGGRGIFRLDDHIDRLLFSVEAVGMKCPYSKKELKEAVIGVVRQSGLSQGYLRPLIYRGEGLQLLADTSVNAMVLAQGWTKMAEGSVTLLTSSVMRIHPKSTNVLAKIAAHYSNSCFAAREAKARGAQDALLLDYQGNVAESSVTNVFFAKGETVFTPKEGNILPGITRDTVIKLLAIIGIEVDEREVSLDEAREADAMFITGTATEVMPVASLDGVAFDINNTYVKLARGFYRHVVHGESADAPESWVTEV